MKESHDRTRNRVRSDHPALRIIGIASAETTKSTDYDVGKEHDRSLAESERKSWKPAKRAKRGG